MKYYKPKHLLFILPVIAIIVGFIVWDKLISIPLSVGEDIPYIKYNNQIIKVEVADEFEEWRQGLSDREFLEQDIGMLFVFPTAQERSFWMKDMHFPIDIVWLLDNKIVKIHTNLPPEGSAPENHYLSDVPVDYVLEINAGYVETLGMRVGEKVEYFLR